MGRVTGESYGDVILRLIEIEPKAGGLKPSPAETKPTPSSPSLHPQPDARPLAVFIDEDHARGFERGLNADAIFPAFESAPQRPRRVFA
jgi:hypothetical protein